MNSSTVMTHKRAHRYNEQQSNTRDVSILKAQPEGCKDVSLHIVLVGVEGTIFKEHTEAPS